VILDANLWRSHSEDALLTISLLERPAVDVDPDAKHHAGIHQHALAETQLDAALRITIDPGAGRFRITRGELLLADFEHPRLWRRGTTLAVVRLDGITQLRYRGRPILTLPLGDHQRGFLIHVAARGLDGQIGFGRPQELLEPQVGDTDFRTIALNASELTLADRRLFLLPGVQAMADLGDVEVAILESPNLDFYHNGRETRSFPFEALDRGHIELDPGGLHEPGPDLRFVLRAHGLDLCTGRAVYGIENVITDQEF